MADVTATDLAERMTRVERDQSFANMRPKDAATLILIDRSGAQSKVLMGRRRYDLKFMPGKFVFPGGRIDAIDRTMPVFGALDARYESAMMQRVQRPSPLKARALALAAIRETFEETGLLIGTKEGGAPDTPGGPWHAFETHGILPDLEQLHFIARAITPPRRPRRFDARFFAADATAIAHQVEDVIGPNAELIELKWLTIDEAKASELPTITLTVLDELQMRIDAGFDRHLPIPFYQMLHGTFHRYQL